MRKKPNLLKDLHENVDINALSLYTLGELRKSADEGDLLNYQVAFEKYFLKSLT